jgi:hypothetical protein
MKKGMDGKKKEGSGGVIINLIYTLTYLHTQMIPAHVNKIQRYPQPLDIYIYIYIYIYINAISYIR